MSRARQLFQSELITVERIDHSRPVPGGDCADCESDRHSINFVERGRFSIMVGRRRWTVGRADLFVTVPGMAYRCRQHVASENALHGVCLDVCFSDVSRDPVAGMRVGGLREHTPVIAVNNRRTYLQQRLAAHLGDGRDPLAVDLIAGELLHSTLTDATSGGAGGGRYKASQLGWYADRIDRAREELDEQYAREHSLAGLARSVGMSPYHFARIFRELSGLPPHRYLVRRRLNAAANRLRDGASVTETCYAVGYRSLSRFIHAFRAATGMTPSQFRSTPRLRESSADSTPLVCFRSVVSQRDHWIDSSGAPRGDEARRERDKRQEAHHSGHRDRVVRADAE
jgi:AraC-like DNA-binding protein